ncbi:MAG: tyrosine-type recombinase/integrase [Candidatus Zixiibacteriota bacterium]
MANIYKRGKIWYIDIRVKGRRVRKRIGPSKRIAELALKDAEVRAAKEEFGFAQHDIAIDRFMVQFLDYSRANHREATTNRYRAVIDHFKEFLRIKQDITFMSEITTEVVDQYKVFRKNSYVNPNGHPVESDDDIEEYTRKGARAHTINFEIAALKTIFNVAIKWGYLKANPTKGIKKLKVIDSKPLKFLSVEECQKFLNACPPDLYPIYFTFLNTGMRKAELENLEWDDIDFKRKKIKIRRKEFWQPKTGEREIPINQQLFDLLQNLKADNDKTIQSNFVFPDRTTGRQIKTRLRERLIKIAKEAGIDGLTKLHTLRHTFASHLVMNGVDLPTVKKLMGHFDIQTTMIYAHLAPDHLEKAVDSLSFY